MPTTPPTSSKKSPAKQKQKHRGDDEITRLAELPIWSDYCFDEDLEAPKEIIRALLKEITSPVQPLELLDVAALQDELRETRNALRRTQNYVKLMQEINRRNLTLHNRIVTLERRVKRRDRIILRLTAKLKVYA